MLPVNPQDVFAFIAGITAMGCFTGIMITWIKWRAGRKATAPELKALLEQLFDKLGRLETAIDTMAVEVERISEAQRFTSRVLAERAGAPALPEKARAGGSTTPH